MTENNDTKAVARIMMLDGIASALVATEIRSRYLDHQVPYKDSAGVEWVIVGLRLPTKKCRTYLHVQCDLFRHAREFGETVPRSSSVFLRTLDDGMVETLYREVTGGSVLF